MPPERRGKTLAISVLPTPASPFEEQRPPQLERQKQRRSPARGRPHSLRLAQERQRCRRSWRAAAARRHLSRNVHARTRRRPGRRLSSNSLDACGSTAAPARGRSALQADGGSPAAEASVRQRWSAVQSRRSTARRAITPIRCARYSASAWMSLFRPSAGAVTPSSDFGREHWPSASSAAFARGIRRSRRRR